MTPPTLYYKSTGPQGESNYGKGRWNLPTQAEDGSWIPGAWRIAYGKKIIPCQTGIHACRREDLVHWLGEKIWAFELAGEELVTENNKVVNRKGRLLFPLAWDVDIARAWVDDTREQFNWPPVDWKSPYWASRAERPSALPSVWTTNRLFDYLEGRIQP